ncbi:MAG: CotH kinase family protein [Lewinellaceae bacterium]|nr:CotH kinase family protein [Lewinellaceae bacterium]
MIRLLRYTIPALFCLLIQPAAAQVFTSSNLPIVIINTGGQAIPDEPKITASMALIDNGPGQLNHPNDAPNGYNGQIGIEIRGSTSQFYAKKPYTIELRDAAGNDQDISLMGMPAESDWALISPLNDKTLMRDVLAYLYAAKAMEWAPRVRFCEVMINGQYEGVYVMLETIKRGKDRVNIKKLETPDIADTSLTGGYLLRIDKYGPSPGNVGGNWLSDFPPKPGAWQQTWFQYRYPKADAIQPEQENYIQNHIRQFEQMLAGSNAAAQYQNWLDQDSWVNYLLVNELTKNTDAYRLSSYFYKDRDDVDPRIKMGPVWDFNIAFGIGDYCNGQLYTGWVKDFNTVCPDDAWIIHFWWEKLWQTPSFRQRVVERWSELRANAWSDQTLFGTIDSLSSLLNQAQLRNFQRWPVMGTYVWPNAFVGNNYSEEQAYLEDWLQHRLEWLDAQMTTLYVKQPEDPAVRVFPNPANHELYIKAGSEKDGMLNYSVSIFSPDGRVVYRESHQSQFGMMKMELPGGLATGLYVIRLMDTRGQVLTGKVFIAE